MKSVHGKAVEMIATNKSHASTTGTPVNVYTLAGLTQADPR